LSATLFGENSVIGKRRFNDLYRGTLGLDIRIGDTIMIQRFGTNVEALSLVSVVDLRRGAARIFSCLEQLSLHNYPREYSGGPCRGQSLSPAWGLLSESHAVLADSGRNLHDQR
jgi:hypothetical protein